MKCNSELHLPVRYVPIPGFGGTFVRLLRHAQVWQLGKCKYLQNSDGQFVGRSSLQGKKWDRESKGAGTLFSPHDEVAAKCYKLAQSAFSATGRRDPRSVGEALAVLLQGVSDSAVPHFAEREQQTLVLATGLF